MVEPGKPERSVLQVTKELYDAGIWKPVEIRYEPCASQNEK